MRRFEPMELIGGILGGILGVFVTVPVASWWIGGIPRVESLLRSILPGHPMDEVHRLELFAFAIGMGIGFECGVRVARSLRQRGRG